MKKTLLVAALAAMLLFAVAGSAFAAGINHSGQDRFGQKVPVTSVDANGQALTGGEAAVVGGVSILGAGTNTYLDWQPALAGNVGDNSPHGNYTTTTVKCVVCHAVHYAAANGAPVGSAAGTADTLLRMRADQACVYCHATSGEAVNGRPVYNGLGGLLIGAPGQTGGATNTGHITGTNCSYCHTNVHGANADHSVASLDGFLLKKMTVADVQKTGAASTDMIGAITAIDHNAVNQGFAPGAALAGSIPAYATTNNATLREQAVGVFCAECHNGAYATGAAGAATNVNSSGGASGVAFSGHRIAAGATNTWNSAGDMSSGSATATAVAWAAANNCKSCHDAVDKFGNTAFPHAWGQASVAVPAPTKMWLLSAADTGSTKTALGGAPANQFDTTKVQLSDGVCLKCHVQSGGAAGVGITF